MFRQMNELNLASIILTFMNDFDAKPALIIAVVDLLTNLAINDECNVKIKSEGLHKIGRLFLEFCPAFGKMRDYVLYKSYI